MTEIKRILMIIFWPTSMLDIFSATTQSVKMVVPIYDFKTSTDIKKEQQNQLMFRKGVVVIHLLNLKQYFFRSF